GRSLARPKAMERGALLSGDSGGVLDPVGSLRTVVSLKPGESRNVVFLLGIARGRDEIECLAATVSTATEALAVFGAVTAHGNSKTGVCRPHLGNYGTGSAEALRSIDPPHTIPSPHVAQANARSRPRPYHGRVEFATNGAHSSETESLQFENGHGGF